MNYGAHEGYVVGFVTQDRCSADSGILRELGYPRDNEERPVKVIAAGCDCGWRSTRWRVLKATWHPFSMDVDDFDDERALKAWKKHVSEL